MTVHEPTTLITDGLLSLVAAALAIRLHSRAPGRSQARLWLVRALGLLAISAAIGGTYHGFAPELDAAWAARWWCLTLLAIHLASAALGASLLHEIAPPRLYNRLRIVVATKLLAFVALATLHPVFLVAVADYGSTLIGWSVAAIVLHRPWRKWMMVAIGLSVGAALVQQLGWAPFPRFNHNDLYHVIEGLALIAFYQAGRRLSSHLDGPIPTHAPPARVFARACSKRHHEPFG